MDVEEGRGERNAYCVLMNVREVLWECLQYSTVL